MTRICTNNTQKTVFYNPIPQESLVVTDKEIEIRAIR